jgi:ketosteroid isomerase-like protein
MIRLLSTLVLTSILAPSALAQNGACTEHAIRTAASTENKDMAPVTDDIYFFSGALEKPVIGKAESDKAFAAVVSDRKNEEYTTTPDRIVIAHSADMAYEYGTGRVIFDEAKSGKHQAFTAAYLRVWKAVDGSCRVAAAMFEPEGKR